MGVKVGVLTSSEISPCLYRDHRPLGLPDVKGSSVGVESRNGRSHGCRMVKDEA